jgi:hypothetical protein
LSQTLTGLPVGAECFGIETDDGGATSVEYDPPRGPQDPAGQSGTVTITPDQQEPVTITVRNVFDPAVLRVVKDVQPEGVLIPPGQIFTAFVECTFEGESIYSGDLPFGVGSPGVVSGLIVGSECTVTESESQGATFDPPSQTVTVDGDTDPVTVDVTITNAFQVGELTVEKVVDDPSGFVGTQTQYTVTVACTFAGQQVPGYPQDVVLTFDSDPSQTLSLLPFGTECVLSEADLVGASSVSFDPSDRVTIGEQGPSVTVTAVNTYPAGTVAVTKAIAGDGAAFVPAGTEFEVTATCTLPEDFPGEDPAPYVLTVTDGSTVTVPPTGSLPVGTVCSVEETDAQGASSSTIVPDSVTVGEGAQSVEVTVTNVYPVGSFPISKEVAGEGAGFVPADTEFGVGVTCEFLGSPVAGFDPFEATLSAASTVTVGPLPVGATCNIVETESNGAGLVSVVPDTVTVGQDEVPVEVVVTNTYDVGSLVIRKVVTGSGAASATDPFEFDIACTFLGTDLDPQPDPVTITPPATSAEVDGLPIGAVCAVTERAPYGGADGPPTVDPGSVTIGADGPVTVTVTNTFTAPPQPPAPHLPATGVTGLGLLAWGSALLIATGGLLALLARRRRSV